jgi:predicted Ser/Thr protein kinase
MAFSLKDYEIQEEIGRGSFGSVYRARQKSLDRVVAIKRLDPGRTQDRHDITRFRREAQAMAALAHDHIVTVYDYAYQAGNYYIVMEYVDGPTLEDATRRGMCESAILHVLERVLRGLMFAHREGIVHRDIKPNNVLLGRQGQVKLADFGLAAVRRSSSEHSSIGGAVGTICYMAPEAMVTPQEADKRVDIFSFGCMAYEALSGELPFPGESIGEVSYGILHSQPSPMKLASGRAGLENAIMSCLSKEREQRPEPGEVAGKLIEVMGASQHEAHEALVGFVRGEQRAPRKTAALRGQPAPAPPISRPMLLRAAAVAGAVAVVAFAVSGIRYLNRTPSPQDLPSLPSMHEPTTAVPAGGQVPRPSSGKTRSDGPAPVIDSQPRTRTGTLRIRGAIGPGDSVHVNDMPVEVAENGVRLPLAPGHYEVVISCADGRSYVRKLEIMPYQKLVWEIPRGRKHDGS